MGCQQAGELVWGVLCDVVTADGMPDEVSRPGPPDIEDVAKTPSGSRPSSSRQSTRPLTRPDRPYETESTEVGAFPPTMDSASRQCCEMPSLLDLMRTAE